MTDVTLEKTYEELKEEIQNHNIRSMEPDELSEFRIIRGASALVLAQKSKQYGDRAVQHATKGKALLDRVKREETVEDKINRMSEALEESLNAQIYIRNQIGSLVGICVAAVLISERSDKELKKLSKTRR
jgi:hypothetical protein